MLYAPVSDDIFSFTLCKYLKQTTLNLIVIVDDNVIDRYMKECRFLIPNVDIVKFPAWNTIPYDVNSPDIAINFTRLKALNHLLNCRKQVIIFSSIEAIVQKTITPTELKSRIITLEKNKAYARDDLIKKLISYGYIKNINAYIAGEFAVRGSIIDIASSDEKIGYRLDFFGSTLEDIRIFDLETQASMSNNNPEYIDVFPASEVVIDEKHIENFIQNFQKNHRVFKDYPDIYEMTKIGARSYGCENWLPYYTNLGNIFDYLSNYQVIITENFNEKIDNHLRIIYENYEKRLALLEEEKYYPVKPESMWLSSTEIINLAAENQITFSKFITPNACKVDAENISISQEIDKTDPASSLITLMRKDKKIILSDTHTLDNVRKLFQKHTVTLTEIKSLDEVQKIKGIGLLISPFKNSFMTDKFMLIADIFKPKDEGTKKTKKKANNLTTQSLKIGDIVVHKDCGIGRFMGLEALDVSGYTRDYLHVVYEDNDKLYLPVENIDLLTKYSDESVDVKLDKLGTLAWQTRKARLKNRIKLAAEYIIQLDAKRKTGEAEIFNIDQELYERFCNDFPHVETPDQLSAVEDILSDLASGDIMDRLVCGDVGFGKTEIAMRAAFTIVSSNLKNHSLDKAQVAVIVPTTLLARQHYNNFKKRFEHFNIRVEQLSRLVKAASAKKTKQDLENGEVDIVIGTHSLLAKSTNFKNLSLAIIDEEQHFGVAQKEKLKEIKSNLHILTLTATPIPRTLHMSLSGMKNLNLLMTPPIDKLPVTTYVMPFDGLVLGEAIKREKARGGKIFYVCPRISDLERIEKKLVKIVPDLKYRVAHGQMLASELEKIINDFYDDKFDILLSTTIVESGLDVLFANTIIIHKADLFGMAQLHQLRGRVGRGGIKAYAYLTFELDKMITSNAMKKLEVLQSMNALGSGIKIATHDMDARGFGNMLGDEQAGHIKEVGLELYYDMLNEEILKIQREKSGDTGKIRESESFSPNINLLVEAFIPESYISDIRLRMDIYRKIATLTSEEIDEVREEYFDRFGEIPLEMNNLFSIIMIKNICIKARIFKLDAGPNGLVMEMLDNDHINKDALIKYAHMHQNKLKLRQDNKIVIFKKLSNQDEKKLSEVQYELNNFIELFCTQLL